MNADDPFSKATSETAGMLYRQVAHLNQRLRSTKPGEGPGVSRMGILGRLAQGGPATASALADHLGLQPQSMTRLLASLQEDRFIQREPDESDRRQSLIRLTDTGRALLVVEVAKRRARLARALASALTPVEQEMLRLAAGLMERVASAMEETSSMSVASPKAAPANFNDSPSAIKPDSHVNIMEPRITSLTLGVADLTRAIRFYRDGLGFPTSVEEGAHIAFFSTRGTRFVLYPLDRLAEYAGVTPPPSGQFSGVLLTHGVRAEADVAAVLALAEKAGGRIVKPAKKVFWSGTAGFFADPDGHIWEVSWSPHGGE
ncbi:MAG TPA: VOC family protein [Verrucomicrobiae bacterium]|nr:VOC family protein [Verrucomicrobiae bacterium]